MGGSDGRIGHVGTVSDGSFARQRAHVPLPTSRSRLVDMQDYHVYQKIGSGKHSVRDGARRERDAARADD